MATKAEKLVKKGQTLAAKGKYERALKAVRAACEHGQYDPDVWVARADVAELAGEREEQVQALFQATDLYARGGVLAEALRLANEVLALDDRHGGARRLKSTVEVKLGIAGNINSDRSAARNGDSAAPSPTSGIVRARADSETAAETLRARADGSAADRAPSNGESENSDLDDFDGGETSDGGSMETTDERAAYDTPSGRQRAAAKQARGKGKSKAKAKRGRKRRQVRESQQPLVSRPAPLPATTSDESADAADSSHHDRPDTGQDEARQPTSDRAAAAELAQKTTGAAAETTSAANQTEHSDRASDSVTDDQGPPASEPTVPEPTADTGGAAAADETASASAAASESEHHGNGVEVAAAPPPAITEPTTELAAAESLTEAAAAALEATARPSPTNGARPGEGELALATVHLAVSLEGNPTADDTAASAAHEIDLEDEHARVVQAVAATLHSSPLLSELDSSLVSDLVSCGHMRYRGSGQTICRQGEAGTSLFLVLGGQLAVEFTDVDGGTRELARLRPGAFFGEMALLTNAPRTATVRALKPSNLLEVSRESIRALVEKDQRILKQLMRFFRARLVGNLLATSSLFSPLTRSEKRELVKQFRLRELSPGHLVIRQGTPADGLFLVLVGELQVFVGSELSDPKVLGLLGPGDVFGEMSLLDGAGAMANIRTRGRSWVLLLPRDQFAALIERFPHVGTQLGHLIEERREANATTLAQGRAPAPAVSVRPV